jgi:hypothetical protein
MTDPTQKRRIEIEPPGEEKRFTRDSGQGNRTWNYNPVGPSPATTAPGKFEPVKDSSQKRRRSVEPPGEEKRFKGDGDAPAESEKKREPRVGSGKTEEEKRAIKELNRKRDEEMAERRRVEAAKRFGNDQQKCQLVTQMKVPSTETGPRFVRNPTYNTRPLQSRSAGSAEVALPRARSRYRDRTPSPSLLAGYDQWQLEPNTETSMETEQRQSKKTVAEVVTLDDTPPPPGEEDFGKYRITIICYAYLYSVYRVFMDIQYSRSQQLLSSQSVWTCEL